MRMRALVEARVDANRLLLATRSALELDADLLAPHELESITASIDALNKALPSEDVAQLEAATDALSQQTEAFAAHRMNRGIRQALTGQHIEHITYADHQNTSAS
jgi:molecular chaperone HscA